MSNINDFEQIVTLKPDFFELDFEKSLSNSSKTAKDSNSSSPDPRETTRKEISKKTNRGRKENITLPKDILKCDICLKYSISSQEKLFSCSLCKSIFHISCYDQFEKVSSLNSDIETIYCIRCSKALKENKSIFDSSCFICGSSNRTLSYNPLTRDYYHKICIYFLVELTSLKLEEICREKIRRWRYKNSCKYCGEKLSKAVAVIKCKKPKCKDYYHIPCAIEKGMIFDLSFMRKYYKVCLNNQIPFFCSNHNKKISQQYKTYIMEKIKEKKEDKKEEKMTFLKSSNSFDSNKIEDIEEIEMKNDKDENQNEFEEKMDVLRQSIASMSINEEDKNEEDNEKQDNADNNDEIFEGKVNMDLDESYDPNEDAFYLDFDKRFKETKNDTGDFYPKDNYYRKSFNVDEFCLNKNGIVINRQNSYIFTPLDE